MALDPQRMARIKAQAAAKKQGTVDAPWTEFVSAPSDAAPVDAPYTEYVSAPPEPKKPGFWESLGLGGAEGVTQGYTGELLGGAASRGGVIDPMFPFPIKGAPEPGIETYRNTRDLVEKRLDEARETHPEAFYPAQIATGMATSVPTAGTGFWSKLGLGAGEALVTGVGGSRGDLTKGEFGEVGADAALSVGFGAGFSAAGQAIGGISRAAKDRAALRALSVANPMMRDWKLHFLSKEDAISAGQRLLDEGVVKFGDDAGDALARLKPAREKAGQEIGSLYGEADEAFNVAGREINPVTVVDDLKGKVLPKYDSGPLRQEFDTATSELDNLFLQPSKGAVPVRVKPSEMARVKTDIGRKAGFDKLTNAGKSDALQTIYGELGSSLNKQIEDVSPEISKKLLTANKRYSELSQVAQPLAIEALKEARGKGFTLGELAAVFAGVAAGAPVTAISAAVAHHALAPRLASMSAKSLQALAYIFGKSAPAAELGARVSAKTLAMEQGK